MVSKASDDLPAPDGPVTTVTAPCGTRQSIPWRLCVRARSISIAVRKAIGSLESTPDDLREIPRRNAADRAAHGIRAAGAREGAPLAPGVVEAVPLAVGGAAVALPALVAAAALALVAAALGRAALLAGAEA